MGQQGLSARHSRIGEVRRELEADQGVLEALAAANRRRARRPHQFSYLNRQQVDLLLPKLSDESRPIAACMPFAALRVGEALALRWQDVDFHAAMLHVPGTKTEGSAQPVPMIADLVAELRAHRARQTSLARLRPDAFVFESRCRKNVLRAIYGAGDAAGLNAEGSARVGCHDLRHSAAGLLLAARVPLPRVAEVLRYANTRTLLATYAGLVESQRTELRGDLEAAFR